MGFKSHIWKKKKKGLVRVHLGHGSTHRVARVCPGCCPSQSFSKPGPVQPPGRPGPGLTHQAGPSLITLLGMHKGLANSATLQWISSVYFSGIILVNICSSLFKLLMFFTPLVFLAQTLHVFREYENPYILSNAKQNKILNYHI